MTKRAEVLGMNVKFQQLDFVRMLSNNIITSTKNLHKEIGTSLAFYLSDALLRSIKTKGISGAYGEVPEVKRIGIDPSILNKKFHMVSFLSEIKQSIVNYEKDLKEHIDNERESALKKMKDAQIKVHKEYNQLLEETKNVNPAPKQSKTLFANEILGATPLVKKEHQSSEEDLFGFADTEKLDDESPDKNFTPVKSTVATKNATPVRGSSPYQQVTPNKPMPVRSSPLRTESSDQNTSPVRKEPITSVNPPPRMMEFVNKLFKDFSIKMKGGDTLNQESTFGINGSNEADKQFIAKASKLKLPSFKQLVIGYLDKYESKDEIVNMNYFMTNAISSPIKYLTLSGGDYGNISRFKSGFSRVLKMITNEIFLMFFEIDELSLKTIIEASADVPRLVICNCKVSVPKEFTLDKKIEYSIQELDLFETFKKTEESFLVPKKMNALVSSMSLTSLKASLTKIHVNQKECVNADGTPDNYLRELLKTYNFKAVLEADDNWPKAASTS